jgi:predicted PurR-regulated permease PerM
MTPTVPDLTRGRQLRFWLAAAIVLAVAIYFLRTMLLPFVAGMGVAYLLDPLADRIERSGAPRWLATTLVLGSFVLILGLALALVAPLVQAQLVALIADAPDAVEAVRARMEPVVHDLIARLSPGDVERLRGAAGDYAGTAVSWLAGLVAGVFSGAVSLIDVLSLVVITPIVAFYLLRDWDHIVAAVDSWLPRPHAETVRQQAREADRILAGFVRGQATVCLALGLFYAVALSLAGLKFGLTIGLVSGLLTFVPYVGSAVGFISSVGVALFQYDSWTMVGVIVGIFVVGQALEGNVLTPKLVGDRVGLHPVWVMFAILAGGTLFGFLGVLLAVPVTAVAGVLVRFGLRQYLSSGYYTGPLALDHDPGVPPEPAAVVAADGLPPP